MTDQNTSQLVAKTESQGSPEVETLIFDDIHLVKLCLIQMNCHNPNFILVKTQRQTTVRTYNHEPLTDFIFQKNTEIAQLEEDFINKKPIMVSIHDLAVVDLDFKRLVRRARNQ